MAVIYKKGEKFPTGLDVGRGRKFQNPPAKRGAGMPTYKRHRLGDLDDGVSAGVTRYNPRKGK